MEFGYRLRSELVRDVRSGRMLFAAEGSVNNETELEIGEDSPLWKTIFREGKSVSLRQGHNGDIYIGFIPQTPLGYYDLLYFTYVYYSPQILAIRDLYLVIVLNILPFFLHLIAENPWNRSLKTNGGDHPSKSNRAASREWWNICLGRCVERQSMNGITLRRRPTRRLSKRHAMGRNVKDV